MSTDHEHLPMQQALYILFYICTHSGFSNSKKKYGKFGSYVKKKIGKEHDKKNCWFDFLKPLRFYNTQRQNGKITP